MVGDKSGRNVIAVYGLTEPARFRLASRHGAGKIISRGSIKEMS